MFVVVLLLLRSAHTEAGLGFRVKILLNFAQVVVWHEVLKLGAEDRKTTGLLHLVQYRIGTLFPSSCR
jgi:hypothetical protein